MSGKTLTTCAFLSIEATILTSPGCWLQVTRGPVRWQEEWFLMFPNVGLAPTVERNTQTNPHWNITCVSCTQTWLTRCAAICALVPSPCVMFTRHTCGRSISRGVEPGMDVKLECSSPVSWKISLRWQVLTVLCYKILTLGTGVLEVLVVCYAGVQPGTRRLHCFVVTCLPVANVNHE